VLLCPSQSTPFWEEQFGRMIVEAMACGVPVVGSRSGEIPFVIGEAGVVVEPLNRNEWFEASYKILTNEKFAEELRKKGITRAQSYSARSLAPLVEQNILEALTKFK
jgi:phosphatidyl-myo-inositol dimannoside synthase